MAFGLKLRHMSKDEINRRVDDAAQILGITQLLERKPRALSGGQRQRVALGRAIVREPQCFLMDEPLSNLDAKLRVQTRAEIIKLQKRLGTTTIYVTHDQVEAMTMGDRIAVMNAGELQQLDTPQNLYDTPANRFVATFIGSPAMNVFPATVANGSIGPTIVAGDFKVEVPASRAEQVRERSGQDVLIGIRPEHMEVAEFAESATDGNTISLPVDLVEHLGSETLLHLRGASGEMIVAKVDPRTALKAGDVARLAVDADHLHVFDPATELALTA
jgi:multiple sugar transport system ATP-binding protein